MRKKIEALIAGGKAVKNLFTGGRKNPNPGQAIKSVKTNVPETKLEKLKSKNVIGGGRLKGAQAKLKQTMFEIKNLNQIKKHTKEYKKKILKQLKNLLHLKILLKVVE